MYQSVAYVGKAKSHLNYAANAYLLWQMIWQASAHVTKMAEPALADSTYGGGLSC